MTDWKLLKLQYEVFGESVENLAESSEVSVGAIEYAVEEENWKQKPLAIAIRDWEYSDKLEDVNTGVLDEVKSRLGVLEALKRSALAPQYMAVEAAILNKALEIVRTLENESNAAGQLKQIAEVIASLKGDDAKAKADGSEKDGINIQILNYVEPQAAQEGI